MATEKKTKPRKFVKKVRGEKKFIRENMGLIRNEAQANGLLEWSHTSGGYVMVSEDNVTPQMVVLAKAALVRSRKVVKAPFVKPNPLKGDTKNLKANSPWTRFWAALDCYDKANKSCVNAAMKAWLSDNPAVLALNKGKRMKAIYCAASRMIAHLDKQAGRDTCSDLIESFSGIHIGSSLIAIYTKDV